MEWTTENNSIMLNIQEIFEKKNFLMVQDHLLINASQDFRIFIQIHRILWGVKIKSRFVYLLYRVSIYKRDTPNITQKKNNIKISIQ